MTIKEYIPSLVRLIVRFFGGLLIAKGVTDYNLESSSLIQILSGVIMIGLDFGLKYLDGPKFALLKLIVGPRVQNISYSLARTVLGVIAGATVGYLGMNQDQLSDTSVYELLVVLASLGVDFISKKIKP